MYLDKNLCKKMENKHPKIKDLPEVTMLEAFKLARLDLTKLVFLPSGGTNINFIEFDISPRDFLHYAKIDFHSKSEAGLINALSNAKRAIDCQIDTVFSSMGVDYLNLPKSLEIFVNCFKFEADLSYKLKIIQGLNLAPSLIIADARNLRHALEHKYQKPEEKAVKNAIDVADLFIRSIEGTLKTRYTEFEITDEDKLVDENDKHHRRYNQGLEISVGEDSLADDKTILIRVITSIDGQHTSIAKTVLTPENPLYFSMFRLLDSERDLHELNESMRVIAKLMNHPIPSEYINIS